ncbi:hypothetical protein [Candidatus Harpocratesius sp.]
MEKNSKKTINFMEYRVILCKYNELVLKSSAYQTQLLTILINSIKKICKRENLTLQSIINLPGRILCFFPSQEIYKATLVFKYIIGIQSFAPAISSARKLAILSQKCIDYLLKLYHIHPFSSVMIVFKGNKNLIKNFTAFSIELRQILEMYFQRTNVPINQINFSENSPDIILKVDLRKKGIYLYHLEYPTHFAGFPIESKKAFLLPWTNSPEEFLAAMLIIRRGAIVVPISIIPFDIQSNHETKKYYQCNGYKLNKSIEKNLLCEISKYYADPIPWLKIPKNEINKIRMIDNLPKYTQWLIFLEKLCFLSIERAFIHMGNRNLHFKGIILPNFVNPESTTESHQFPILNIPVFYPLMGIPYKTIEKVFQNYEKNPCNFSFHRIISQKEWKPSISSPTRKVELDIPSRDINLQLKMQLDSHNHDIKAFDLVISKISSNLQVELIKENILKEST